MARRNKKALNKKILIGGTLVLVAIVAFGGWRMKQQNKPEVVEQTPSSDTQTEEPDSTETQSNLSEADQAKDRIVEQTKKNEASNNQSTGQKPTDVVISYAQDTGSSVDVGAYANTFEKSGTCSLTLTKGSSVVKTSRNATPNVSTMSCGALSISKSKLTAGTWTVKVSYSSSKYHGEAKSSVIIED